MALDNPSSIFRCGICNVAYETAEELAYHNRGHGTPSNVKITRGRRTHRKVMNAETFARFCYSAAEVLNDVKAEFDPSADEMQKMLFHLAKMVEWLKPTTKRRTS